MALLDIWVCRTLYSVGLILLKLSFILYAGVMVDGALEQGALMENKLLGCGRMLVRVLR